jgi:hypothetical protein
MKVRWKLTVRLLLLTLMILFVAVIVKDSTHQFLREEYDVAESTSVKVAKISRWISTNSDFEILFDVWRLMQNPMIASRVMKVLEEEDGGVYDLLKAFLMRNSSIGMLMFQGRFDSAGEALQPRFVAVAQGSYNKEEMVEVITSTFGDSDVSPIDVEGLNGNSVYCDDLDMQFCFSFLDDEHLAIGYRTSFEELLAGLPSKIRLPEDVRSSMIAGQVTKAPKLAGQKKIKELYFWSNDGQKLFAVLPYKSVSDALDARILLEGMRSLLMMQNEGRESIIKILQGIKIYDDEEDVFLELNILNLI